MICCIARVINVVVWKMTTTFVTLALWSNKINAWDGFIFY
jgi:hypothetical protein